MLLLCRHGGCTDFIVAGRCRLSDKRCRTVSKGVLVCELSLPEKAILKKQASLREIRVHQFNSTERTRQVVQRTNSLALAWRMQSDIEAKRMLHSFLLGKARSVHVLYLQQTRYLLSFPLIIEARNCFEDSTLLFISNHLLHIMFSSKQISFSAC